MRRQLPACGALLALFVTVAAGAQAPAPAAAASAPQPAASAPAPALQVLPRSVTVAPAKREDGPFSLRSSASQLARARASTSDTARLLQDLPGVSLYGAGGVSSLPAIQGLADDRLRTQVDGMDMVAACPNHMNPALSYIDPTNVGSVTVYAGISPVSVGGDSIGGAIQVESAIPEFASEEAGHLLKGQAGLFYRSNGQARGRNATLSFATERLHVALAASTARQANFRAARGFKPAVPGSETGPVIPADEVGSSAYEASNQELRLAWRSEHHLLQLSLGHQRIGFEGFPNQRMDMTDNLGNQVNLRYTGRFDGLRLKGRFWQQRVRHAMDMGPDRYFYGFGMPMLTEATTQGLQLQAEKDLGETDLLRVGAERQTYVLYDWWPPVGGSMGPNAFWNVDNGRRLRSGAFAEWQTEWREHWTVLAGLRADRIDSDAEAVQGYDNGLGAIWGNDAAAFNARRRERRDDLIDVALTARYQPHAGASYEFGLARKARAPNLYQRYAWSTQPMAALMNNFMGDGNGYVGDVDLRPEVADKLAFTADWHDAADQNWAVKATLHFSRVHDFMDARRCNFSQCSAANVTATEGFVLLQYQNVPAQLYGLDLSGRSRLLRGAGWGELNANLVLSVVRGRNLAANDPLYNLMPPNLRLSLEHKRGGLTTTAELVAVGAKHRVSQVRNEIPTPGYALAHLRASYEWRRARLDVGVDNLFNRFYFPPLGGAYLGQGRSMTSAGIAWGTAVPGAGRSINTALSVWF